MNLKSERQDLIAALVTGNDIRYQEDLLKLMQEKGFFVTQATLSRDLKELKIAKVHTPSGMCYKMPAVSDGPGGFKTIPLEGIVSLEYSGSLAVIKTQPGFAPVVASLIDRCVRREVMGTIAGDDTILLVIRAEFNCDQVTAVLDKYIPGIATRTRRNEFTVEVASEEHVHFVPEILKTIEDATKVRGTGIAKRDPEYVARKIREGKAIIALHGDEFAGFCYIESWSHEQFVANSGLIVKTEYRGQGLAKAIKRKAFELSRSRFPNAKLFGLTTGLAVMKINTELGYVPVTFSELTDDPVFWKGCESCVNYDILCRNNYTKCLCTGMLFDPAKHPNK